MLKLAALKLALGLAGAVLAGDGILRNGPVLAGVGVLLLMIAAIIPLRSRRQRQTGGPD
jgi:hypothetical protein